MWEDLAKKDRTISKHVSSNTKLEGVPVVYPPYACLWFGVLTLGLSVIVWAYGWHGYCWHGVVKVIVTLLILLRVSIMAHVHWVSCSSRCSGPRVPGIVGCFECFCSCVIELFELLSIGCSSRRITHDLVIRRPSGHHIFGDKVGIWPVHAMATVVGSITAYTPDENWQQYVERLQFFMEANGVTDTSRKSTVAQLSGNPADTTVHSHVLFFRHSWPATFYHFCIYC